MHLVVDSAAGLLMLDGKVDICFVGADRAVLNGDVANKIGTYKIAVLVCVCVCVLTHAITFHCTHHPLMITANVLIGAVLLFCRPKSMVFRSMCVCPLPPLI